VDVGLLGPMPTPAVAYLTRTLRASAGIVISASHNLFEDNGIKFFSAEGGKLPDSLELAIEAEMDKPLQTVAAVKLGKAKRIHDAPGRYIEFCKSTIPPLTRLTGLKLVVDCAHGATYHVAPNVFSELGAEVIAMGDKPDGFNINQGVGSTAPESLQERVVKSGADLGIALDGDGDRLILVDAAGEVINGDQIIYVIAQDRFSRGQLNGGIVGTLMSNFGLEAALTQMGVPFERAQVGDRYVLEALKEKSWKIGGESSGHIVCLDKTTTGDGIVSALQVLCSMIKQEKSLRELVQGMELVPQRLINVKTTQAKALMKNKRVMDSVKQCNHVMENQGRVLLRPSGTEPLLRIMVEGFDAQKVDEQAEILRQVIVEAQG
jgi:phosphoglucosamine mutase